MCPGKIEPICSYGILMYYIDDNTKTIWYLLAQRRDTIEYSDFIRGKYVQANLETYFSLMTIEERDRLRQYNFDELWDDLWVNHDGYYYRNIKPRAKVKFMANSDNMNRLLETTVSTRIEPGWGFPKGKKNTVESEVECAFREFKEETKMALDYKYLKNTPCVKEVFKGTNGKMYGTSYYLAEVQQKPEIRKMATGGAIRSETVSEEISNLRWCRLAEAKELLPPWRYKLLKDVEEKILESR